MRFIEFVTPAVLAATTVNASPLPVENGNSTGVRLLSERQSAARLCDGVNLYTANQQAYTYQYGRSFDITGTTVTGSNGVSFPHDFRNDEGLGFPDCPGVPPPYREFPIIGGGLLFTPANDPGPDRIVYKITNTDPSSNLPHNFVYCGVMTHLGVPNNGFQLCADIN